MERSLPAQEINNRPVHPKRDGRKKSYKARLKVRSNSICALSCQREARTAATTDLCCMYRLSTVEPGLPIWDSFFNLFSSAVRKNISQTEVMDCPSALLDLPMKHVEILHANRWNFDMFCYQRRCTGHLVCSLGIHLLETHDLFRVLHLDYLTVMRTLIAIESVYWRQNPYHTALHASDVTQAIHCFIMQSRIRHLYSSAELLGAILAALCHDADHPGTNQHYLERTGHFLAKLYNANSVLEQHHARVGLTIFHQSGLVSCLDRTVWNTVRDCVLKMVHATDMAHQGFYKAKFIQMISAKQGQRVPSYSSTDRILLLQMSLKCADVSNPCRPWPTCRQWAYRICQEFFSQGDQERLRWNLVPSRGCDRTGASVPAIQIAFIDTCIRPLFQVWDDFFQSSFSNQLLQLLDANYQKWQQLSASENQSVAVASAALSQVLKKQKKRRKLPKCKLLMAKSASNTPLSGNRNPTVTFGFGSRVQSTKCYPSSKEKHCAPKDSLQTFFITTSGIRRHSLPETQGAIKKTFNFSPFKKPVSTMGIDGQVCSTVSRSIRNESAPAVRYLYVTTPAIRSFRTASENILQTLCEEIISQEPSSNKPRCAFDLDPFPLPEAWNTSGNCTSGASPRPSYLTGLTINVPMSDFIAFAHRRSSVPLVDK